jgi:hypothetical protein
MTKLLCSTRRAKLIATNTFPRSWLLFVITRLSYFDSVFFLGHRFRGFVNKQTAAGTNKTPSRKSTSQRSMACTRKRI